MRYSVYNYTSKVYDYFDGPGPGGTHAKAPTMSAGIGAIGATPEQAAWRVPFASRKIGSGPMPQGRIASLGDDAGSGSLPGPVLAVGAAVLAWWMLRRKGRP